MFESSEIEQKVKNLPEAPGIYKYIDKNGTIIYIGKAKNLKKRVSSYFTKTQNSAKTQILVKNIKEIDYLVLDSEFDALLLENNLIKEIMPKYNIMLKDDKSYPYICIKNEMFPRIFSTRKKENDGSLYFGPFSNVYMMKTLLELIKSLYPIRTCKLNLSEENIKKAKFQICLNYHIGNCLGCCIGEINNKTYNAYLNDIKKIIKGDLYSIKDHFRKEMFDLAAKYKFEEAAKIKNKLEIIENYTSKTVIVDSDIKDVEVFGYEKDENAGYISYLQVRNGAIIITYNLELKKKIEESDEDMLLFGIVEIRKIFDSTIKNIILPFNIKYKIQDVKIEIFLRGDKQKLFELAQKNAKIFKLDCLKLIEVKVSKKDFNRKLVTLKNDLHLTELPLHIECFDNSNIQGTNPVASCVVFKNGKPSKKDYRHFNIKTVEGPNDFASMEEIIRRRYSSLIEEKSELPQLIIVDGGKGQLHSAVNILKELNLYGKLAIIGIAKRLEEIYFPNDNLPLYLDKNSESLKIIQHARNEAHRFGINFHRNQRSKNFIKTQLTEIQGVGEKTSQILLKKYKSVEKIKSLSLEELEEVIGKSKAEAVFNGLLTQS